jgi:Mrp family chromosome partitioning ATPase
MFDSLRRAEAARKRKLSESPPEPDKPTIVPTPQLEPVPSGAVQLDGLPEGFLRELGILKNALESAVGKTDKRTLMFVSSTEGEGTTTIASNFARLLSLQSQEKVLLIEMNARRPSLYWKFGLDSNLGVAHYLEGKENLDAIVQPTAQGSFDIIHVGESDPIKIQVHLDRMFPSLLQSARQKYDTILIDASPVIGSPETPPLSAHADGVVVVVHCGKTKREIVQRSLGLIGQFNGNVLGVVLNRKKYYIPEFIYRRI